MAAVRAVRDSVSLWLVRAAVLGLLAAIVLAIMAVAHVPGAKQAVHVIEILEVAFTVAAGGLALWGLWDHRNDDEADSRYRQPGGDDDRPWEPVNSLADLGAFCAQWLLGEIRSQPAYAQGFGPDPETVPYLEELAAVNRAGFYTTSSQPGLADSGMGTGWWTQQAEVQGFADDDMRDRLELAARARGLHFFAHRAQAKPDCPKVTIDYGGGPVQTRGVWLSKRYINGTYRTASPEVRAALINAWQVTIIDPGHGNDRLWPLLAEVAAQGQTGKDQPTAAQVKRVVRRDAAISLACKSGGALVLAALLATASAKGWPVFNLLPFGWLPCAAIGAGLGWLIQR
jgi:hypothetical protein